jgi:hypothetical protein
VRARVEKWLDRSDAEVLSDSAAGGRLFPMNKELP